MSDRCKSRTPQSMDRLPLLLVAMFMALVAEAPRACASPAAPSGRSFFFATREACHASGVFSRQECAIAFTNALAELRDRAPTFRSIVECRLRFALCEPRRDGSGYAPVGLGVEIVVSPHGARVAPALAVEAPGALFPLVPVTQDYAAQETPTQQDDGRLDRRDDNILPADRFEPFAKRPRIEARFSFYNAAPESAGAPPPETPEQRRARLRAAPFVE